MYQQRKSANNLGPARSRRCKNICHQLRSTSAYGVFLPSKILLSRTKLQKRRRPTSEQDKFLSRVKTVRFYNLQALIRLKTSTKEIWSRFLESVHSAEARQNISFLRGNRAVKIENDEDLTTIILN